MKALKEIASISQYRPPNGSSLQLYKLVLNGYSREDAKVKLNLSAHSFNHLYHQLKEYLVLDVLNNPVKDLSRWQRATYAVRRKYEAAKMFIMLEKRAAGIPICRSTMRKAEELGLWTIALDLSRELCMHYSYIEPDKKKYEHYCGKQDHYKQQFDYVLLVERRFYDFSHWYTLKGETERAVAYIEELAQIPAVGHRFHYLRFMLQVIYQQATHQETAMLATCKAALDFFKEYKTLPYVLHFSFYYRSIAGHLALGEFAQAEVVLNLSLQQPKRGSQNWQILMLHKALLGFYSNKLAIAADAYRQSLKIPKSHRSQLITERWRIVRAYLELFDLSIGRWKLSKFMNSFPFTQGNKQGPYISVLIAELLHLLQNKQLEAYRYKCERLVPYIDLYLKSRPEMHRFVLFMRLLQCVVRGGFVRIEIQKKAKPYIKQLQQHTPRIGADVREVEVVPFERLWEMVIGWLK